jgi:hypothetical protein
MKRILFNRSFVFLLMMLFTISSFGQNGRTITGKVTDTNGAAHWEPRCRFRYLYRVQADVGIPDIC